jgi:hypothetical protein
MFTFNRGTWEDGSPLPEWEDGEDSGSYLKRIGYLSSRTVFGHEDSGHIEIFEASDSKTFYASVCPMGDAVYEVFLPDFPSYMIFMRDYGTAFASEATNISQQQMLVLLEKLFQAEHGHSVHNICAQCDPLAWEHRIKNRS